MVRAISSGVYDSRAGFSQVAARQTFQALLAQVAGASPGDGASQI